jgi:hypothetical protein
MVKVKFDGSDAIINLKDYEFKTPRCNYCHRSEDKFERAVKLWYCKGMSIFYCASEKCGTSLNLSHNDSMFSKCYDDNVYFHHCLSHVVTENE